MRHSLFLICVLGISCAAWSQRARESWSNLGALHPGQRIQIVEVNSKKHSGTFVSFTEAAIVYQDDAGGQTIPKQDVRKVSLMENNHRLRKRPDRCGSGRGCRRRGRCGKTRMPGA